VDDDVRRCFWVAVFVAFIVVVGGEGIENLTSLGQVGLQSVDAGFWVRKWGEVKVEDLMSDCIVQ